MIMPIAIAREGFINLNENPLFSASDNFLQCLKKLFIFENKDLQFFDGNTCRLINAYDPTNSIFIYENQQGVFLYQITSASPVIHKNNMIWNCNCYKMEDINKINEICADNKSAQFEIIKNIFPSHTGGNTDPFSKVEVKGNFKPIETIQSRVGANLCAFKIKCYVNPTSATLDNHSNDGSFNFFFPMLMYERTTTTGETETDITNAIKEIDGTSILKLSDIISKYSQQIKSIEFIPFFPQSIGEMGGGISQNSTRSANVFNIETIGNAVYTDLGIFIPQGHYSSGYNFTIDLPNYFLPKQLVKGGGVRGFLRTPLGNIQLDFELNKYNIYNDISTYTLKDEGWKLDGAFKCEVPPHYINYYTDNAGQVFIQNLTTNAQELRQLERETIAKQQEQEQQFVFNTLQKSTSVLSNIVTGNIGGALSNLGSIANNAVELEFNKSRNEREYNRSLTEYNDKIKTQSLLASLTGKQIGGNVGLIEFLESFNCNFFKIFIETNYTLQYVNGGNHIILPQKDYDYSTTSMPNAVSQNVGQLNNNKVLAVFSDGGTANYNGTLTNTMKQIFGFDSNQQIQFRDEIGLNYYISFIIKNTMITGGEDIGNLQYTNQLLFPIRRIAKFISNEI